MERNKVKDAMGVLIDALEQDSGYYDSWLANLAMAYKDEIQARGFVVNPGDHLIATSAGERFLGWLMSKKK